MAAIIALLVLLWAEANGCWIWMVLGIFWMPLRFHVDIARFLPMLGYFNAQRGELQKWIPSQMITPHIRQSEKYEEGEFLFGDSDSNIKSIFY